MLQSCQRCSPVGEPGPVPFWGVSQQLDATQAPPAAVLRPPAPAGTGTTPAVPTCGQNGPPTCCPTCLLLAMGCHCPSRAVLGRMIWKSFPLSIIGGLQQSVLEQEPPRILSQRCFSMEGQQQQCQSCSWAGCQARGCSWGLVGADLPAGAALDAALWGSVCPGSLSAE